jgi:hypothetical protein
MGNSIGAAHDPSAREDAGTSPRWRAGRNVIGFFRLRTASVGAV